MNAKPTKRGRIWLGVACTVLAGWLIAAALYLVTLTLSDVSENWIWFWMATFFVVFWSVSALLAGWLLGMIGSFFWHDLADISEQKQWGQWTLFPILIVPAASCCCVLAIPLVGWPFMRALEFGESWWPNRGWRWFFGLSNEWERDTDEAEKP